jgi:hypothetical protein
MTTTNQRNQILETLSVLDQEQAEKVLAYMKGILYDDTRKAVYKQFKREAMRDIRQALNNERKRK